MLCIRLGIRLGIRLHENPLENPLERPLGCPSLPSESAVVPILMPAVAPLVILYLASRMVFLL